MPVSSRPSDGPLMRADARRNREKILAAAVAVVAEEGVGASLEEIARRAGVGSATLHRHFDSRAALLQATFHDRIIALCERADELAQHADSATALMTWLRELISHATATRGLPALLVELPDTEGCTNPHRLIRQAGQQLLSRAHNDGNVSAEVSVDDVLHLANGIALATEATDDPDHNTDRFMAILVNGLIHPRRGGRPHHLRHG